MGFVDILKRIVSTITSFILMISSLFNGIGGGAKAVKNVIYMIGDGMGSNHLEMAKYERNISLAMDTFPQKGYAMTYSASDEITDSAAGATALACGVKTYNGAIGYYWDQDTQFHKNKNTHPKSITELAEENGLKTGIVTSDYNSGATPGGFSAHTDSRNNAHAINDQQLKSGIDLIWGRAESDSYVTKSKAEAAGYVYVDSVTSMDSVRSYQKSYGQFTDSVYHTYQKNSKTPTLSQMAEHAIDILSSSNKKGFFLMIEGAHIDKKSHSGDMAGAAEALEEFDRAVKKALDFAKEDGHTLVVVTADHETGGITKEADGSYVFTSGGSHTDANAPVLAYGPYDFIKSGEVINNIEIPVRIADALEFGKNSLPCEVKN